MHGSAQRFPGSDRRRRKSDKRGASAARATCGSTRRRLALPCTLFREALRARRNGRSGGTRTHGPRFWRPMLYQLSYTPAGGSASIVRAFAWQATRSKADPMHAQKTAGAPQVIPAALLLTAYRSGIFPMADGREDTEIYWVEPRERAIIPLEAFHLSRSLAKA